MASFRAARPARRSRLRFRQGDAVHWLRRERRLSAGRKPGGSWRLIFYLKPL
jgi:hypothetical protein